MKSALRPAHAVENAGADGEVDARILDGFYHAACSMYRPSGSNSSAVADGTPGARVYACRYSF